MAAKNGVQSQQRSRSETLGREIKFCTRCFLKEIKLCTRCFLKKIRVDQYPTSGMMLSPLKVRGRHSKMLMTQTGPWWLRQRQHVYQSQGSSICKQYLYQSRRASVNQFKVLMRMKFQEQQTYIPQQCQLPAPRSVKSVSTQLHCLLTTRPDQRISDMTEREKDNSKYSITTSIIPPFTIFGINE